MPQNCHNAKGDWVCPDPYLLASVSTDKVWQSLLSGTLVFVAGHINLMVTQAKEADKTDLQSHKGAKPQWNMELNT